MKFIKFLFLALIFSSSTNFVYGGNTVSGLDILVSEFPDREALAYYDLRDRKTFIQVTNVETEDPNALPNLCIHVQIFQQDQGCTELDFEDELTPNDTVIYDLDNLIRNNGTGIPINLNDDSYGFVAISAFICGTNRDEEFNIGNPIIGNFRIIDDAGYEYRMNLVSDDRNDGPGQIELVDESNNGTNNSNVIIPFNTIDSSNYADIVGFVVNDNRSVDCVGNSPPYAQFCNDPAGVTFSVFQIDENEERLSCDQVNFACGEGKVMNYGINEEFKNSRGGPLLCEGASLLPDQKHGYISLENATYNSMIGPGRESEFVCLVGLNNNNGTGSMDNCQVVCIDEGNDCDGPE